MAEIETQSTSAKRGKSKLLVIVLAVVVVGAGAFFGGKLLSQDKDKSKDGGKAREAAAKKVPALAVMHLESFVVNLSDGPGTYLRVGLDLGLAGEAGAGKEKENQKDKEAGRMAIVRDTILGVLMRQTAQDVATAEGKARLKQELLAALQQRLPELGVVEVYYTDFLLQS
jgi:flagellar FliL protein